MTGYINTATGEIVEDYKAVEENISRLNGSDLQDYILTNYGDFFEMCVEIIEEGETKLGNSVCCDIDLLTTAIYNEMKTVKYNEWEYFNNDADCLKYESDD